jgi:HEAT repeat protein
MTDQQPKHVFISYVRENRAQVDRLARDLEKAGVNVWLDRHSIKPGVNWKIAIRDAIKEGAFFIACFSKEYQSREETHMNEELTLAIERLRTLRYGRVWFIPVLLSECDVPARSIGAGETLLDINWVSLYENWEDGIQKILNVIKPIPPEIQNLITALGSEDRNVRMSAVTALGETDDPSVIPILIQAFKGEDKEVRQEAARALGRIGPEAKAAVPVLIDALETEDIWVRKETASTLGQIGPAAKTAVPILLETLNNRDVTLRWSAFWALKAIGPKEAKTAVPALIKALKDEDENVRYYAVQALHQIGPDAETAVPALIKALKDEDEDEVFRQWVVRTLGQIGPDAETAVPALVEELKDEDKVLRNYVAKALKNIDTPEAQKALKEYEKRNS